MLTNEQAQIATEIAASAALFIFVWWFLRGRVFLPYIAVIEEREARTTGDADKAKAGEKEKLDLQRLINDELREARYEAIQRREEKLKAAKQQANLIAEQANAAAQQELDKSRVAIAQLKAQAEREVQTQVPALAAQIIEQVVSNKGASRVVH